MDEEIKHLLDWEKATFGKSVTEENSKCPITSSLLMIEECPDLRVRSAKFNLSDCELLVIVMLTGFHSDFVNGDRVKDKTIQQKIRNILQSALLKLPKYDNNFDLSKDSREYNCDYPGTFLYRRLDYVSKGEYYVGREWVHPVSLTATIENFGALNSGTVILEIKPLPINKTKSHKVYLVRDQCDEIVEKYPKMDISKEWQVNFEFNTKFKVTNIRKIQEKTGDKITYTLISVEESDV